MPDIPGLNEALNIRKKNHLYRSRQTLDSAQGAEVIIDGKHYVNFCSNDYLGLANHPDVITAFKQSVDKYGVGSGASHLVCGHSKIHHELEHALAAYTGRERALLFSTGYMANLGVINALLGKKDFIFEDKLNHASLLDAGLLSGARFQRFLHNDINSLRLKLNKAGNGRKLITVDGVFSMDGDLAPLPQLVELAEQHNACLMVDDAHGFGVLGTHGMGSVEHYQLSQQQVPILMATLGKSVGSFGAFVAGSEQMIETLIQHARPYIYTTALPPAVAAASLAGLNIIINEPLRRINLQQRILQFKNAIKQLNTDENLGLTLVESPTAIQPLLIGNSEKAIMLSEKLKKRGMLVSAIRPPTVPDNTARLRVTLSSAHTENHVQQLINALSDVMTCKTE